MGEFEKNVLVRAPNWIGDAILSFPSLKAIADSAARISLIAHARTAPLFKQLKWVDELFSFRSKRELLQLSLKLRSRKFNAGIVFPLSFSSAAFLFLAGVAVRNGYSRGMRGVFLTEAVEFPRDYRTRHLVYTYFRLARSLSPQAQYSHPTLAVPSCSSDGLLIGIAPGSTFGPAKRWRTEKFVELASKVVTHCDCRIHVFGGKEEHPIEPSLNASVKERVQDFTGKIDILKTASLIAQCRVMVTNDTGLMHLACAVGTPVIALFGSTNPCWTGPLGQNHSVIRKPLPCSPCYRRTCPYGTYECLEKIDVDDVFRCVQRYL
jgi:heptosyltransferase-2